MKVRAIYRPTVLTAGSHEDLMEVASRMQYHEVGSLAIFYRGVLQGIITERDLARALADGVDPAITTVRAYMTQDPITVTPETPVAEAARLMLDIGTRHLPVMEGGEVVGMISARDLMATRAWATEDVDEGARPA